MVIVIYNFHYFYHQYQISFAYFPFLYYIIEGCLQISQCLLLPLTVIHSNQLSQQQLHQPKKIEFGIDS